MPDENQTPEQQPPAPPALTEAEKDAQFIKDDAARRLRLAPSLGKEVATEAAERQLANDKAEAAKKKLADDAALELATRPDPKPKK
jgi:hypothetical protein